MGQDFSKPVELTSVLDHFEFFSQLQQAMVDLLYMLSELMFWLRALPATDKIKFFGACCLLQMSVVVAFGLTCNNNNNVIFTILNAKAFVVFIRHGFDL